MYLIYRHDDDKTRLEDELNKPDKFPDRENLQIVRHLLKTESGEFLNLPIHIEWSCDTFDKVPVHLAGSRMK